MSILNQILTACYFMAMATAFWKSIRYFVDYYRSGQWFYLLGVPANIALLAALALILVNSGENPKISEEVIRIWTRAMFMLWAIFGILFELLNMKTFVVIGKRAAKP